MLIEMDLVTVAQYISERSDISFSTALAVLEMETEWMEEQGLTKGGK